MHDSHDDMPDEHLLIDTDFHVAYGKEKTGSDYGIHVINKHRKLKLKAHDAFEWFTWLKAFKTAIDNNGLQTKIMRQFDAFAPERPNNDVKIYIDAHDYFDDLYDELNRAQSQIFITDWWLTPELYLKRSVNLESKEMDQYRLDNVLQKQAKRGVKIYVLVWRELKIGGIYNSSEYVKSSLEGKHKNISVIRHPKSTLSLWSHHEKLCVIDQKKGFLGGIDLCLGRYVKLIS